MGKEIRKGRDGNRERYTAHKKTIKKGRKKKGGNKRGRENIDLRIQ